MNVLRKSVCWKCTKIFVVLIFLFLIVMLATWAIPDKMLKYNVNYSMDYVENGWVPVFTYEDAATLDDFTDRLCLTKALKEGSNPKYNFFQSMLDMKEYPRYWHGYLVVLRPLLCVGNYLQIRYFNMFFLMTLLAVVFTKLKESLNWGTAIVFMISICVTNFIIVPWSLQFSPVYYVMLTAMALMMQYYQSKKRLINFWIQFFFIIGMLINFFDFLSAPLLTLGIPLCLLLLLDMYDKTEEKIWEQILRVFKLSIAWVCGYASSWIAKWTIATVALHKNVLLDGFEEANYRCFGEDYTIVEALSKNIRNLAIPHITEFMDKWYGIVLIVVFWIFIVGMIVAWHHKGKIKTLLPLLLLSLYPYVWIVLLKEHSYQHWIFVYRIQMITVFCLLSMYVYLFDWKRCKETLYRVFMRK